MILVHGSASDRRTWTRQIEAIAATTGSWPRAAAGLLLALEEPALFRSLVLCEPPAFTLVVDPPRPSEIGRLLFTGPRAAFETRGVGPATAAMKRGDIDRALEVFGRATLGSQTFGAQTVERLDQARSNLIGAELLGSGFPTLDPGRVAEVRLPVLLVGADSSRHCFGSSSTSWPG